MRPRRIPFSYYFLTGIIGVTFSIVFPAMIRQLTLVFGIHLLSFVLILTALFLSLSSGAVFIGRLSDKVKSAVTAYFILSAIFIAYLVFHAQILEYLTHWAANQTYGKFGLVLIRFLASFAYFLIPGIITAGMMPLLLRIYIRSLGETGLFVSSALMSLSFGALIGAVISIPVIKHFGLHYLYFLATLVFAVSTGLSLILFRRIRLKSLLNSTETSAFHEKKQIRFRKKKVILEAGAKLTKALLYGSVFQTFAYTSMLILSFRILIRHNDIIIPVFYSINVIIVLLGLISGSLLYKKTAEKTGNKYLSLATLQVFSGFASLVSFAVLHIFLMKSLQALVPDNFPTLVFKESLFSGILLFIPSLLYGISLPVAGRLYPKRLRLIATNSGKLTGLVFLSIIAALFITPYIIIPLAGIELAFILLSLLILLSGVYLIFRDSRLIRMFRLGYGFIVVVLFIFIAGYLYVSDFKNIRKSTDLNEEGSTVSVNVISDNNGKILYLNNDYYVSTDPDGKREQILSALVPLALQPQIKTALVMGFGTGITPDLLDRQGLSKIHITDVFAEIIRTASVVFSDENNDVLSSPRVDTDIEDARSYLNRTSMTFDLITSGSEQLFHFPGRFTREFYQLTYSKLSKNGILCQILPFHELSAGEFLLTLKTARSVFGFTSIWYISPDRMLLVSSKKKPAIDYCELDRTIGKFNRNGVLLQAGIAGAEDLVARFFMTEGKLYPDMEKMKVKTDDKPFLKTEYSNRDSGKIREFFTEIPGYSGLIVFGPGCQTDTSTVLHKVITVNRSLLEQAGQPSLQKRKHVVDFFESNAALIQRYL